MQDRWGSLLTNDPAYSPNLTLERENFSYAWPPIMLDRFINERRTFMGRLRYAFRGETYRQAKLDDIIFRALIILNRI